MNHLHQDPTTLDSARADARETEADTSSRTRAVETRMLRALLQRLGDPPIEFTLGEARALPQGCAVPVARVRIADRSTLVRVMLNGEIEFGDGYADGRIEVDGDLGRMLEEIYRRAPPPHVAPAGGTRRLRRARKARRNTLAGSKDNIHHHYDIGNDFYALWLGPTMAYTCAYYPAPEASLDEAQVAKMEHVCRKLRLSPGEKVIEAGCGWGSLALHMASRHGVTVRAFNISGEQVRYARDAAARAGLAGRVEFIEDDYRNASGRCDAFVSVGMLEHVGLENYREFGAVIARCLDAEGRGLVHTIGRNRPAPMHPWIERRIFPGAYPPSLWEMSALFEPFDLSVLDVENLRLHYARTLAHWWEAFERHREQVAAMFDQRFVRMWRLYLAGSSTAFRTGQLQLFQVLFAPGRSNAVPWTRAHLYAG